MAVPSSDDARLYYRCAIQRFEEAEVLLDAEKPTGAVYLAGYGIECILKALVLMAVPSRNRREVMNSFRGGQGHDYEWLKTQYVTSGGARLPADINRNFTLVNDWSTDLRYSPRSVRASDADAFVKAAEAIIRWADGRL